MKAPSEFTHKFNSKVTWPKDIYVSLPYYSGQIGATSTVTPYEHVFRANSLYDPDLSGTGHQPYLFDEYKTFYSNYHVLAIQVEVWASVISTTTSGILGVSFSPSSYSSLYDLNEMMESNKRVHAKHFDNQNRIYIKRKARLAKIQGISEIEWLDQALYASGTGASPVICPSVTIAWQHIDGTTTFQPYVDCRLTYFVKFYNPVHVTSS